MTIDINLPSVSDIHVGYWIGAGVLAWYMLFGAFIRLTRKPHMTVLEKESEAIFWAMSPVGVPILLIVAVVWTFVWAISFGVVEAPWSS